MSGLQEQTSHYSTYSRTDPPGEPDWRWLRLWEQENPNPGREGFDDWYEHR